MENHFVFRNHNRLIVKKSGIEGKGLFTWKKIKKHAVIFKLKGPVINHNYTPEFSEEGPNWIGIGTGKWIMPEQGDISLYINHSCQPNVIVNAEHKLISLKEIKIYEELVLDYSTTELDPYWTMQCNCGAATCRHIIRSFQFLPPNLKEKYMPYLPPDFKTN